MAARNRIPENKQNLQADLGEYRNWSQFRESSFAFVFLLDKVYVYKTLIPSLPCYITFISHKNDVIIIVKLHRATRLRQVAPYKSLTMIMPGGAHVKILTGMLVLFFWVWNLAKSYFSGLAIFLAIFLGFARFPLFFWVWQISSYIFGSSNFCITHLNPLNEEHTVLKNIK